MNPSLSNELEEDIAIETHETNIIAETEESDSDNTEINKQQTISREIENDVQITTQRDSGRTIENNQQQKLKTQSSNVQNVTQLQGVALKHSTNVYAKASQNSQVLKSYKQGHILIFRPYNSNWYVATVYIKGKKNTGYIYSKDVDLINESSSKLQGHALKQPVTVYSKPSRSANVLKSYNYNQLLIYRPFSSHWYKATIYLKGKAHTGYIHASDVGKPSNSQAVRGIGLANETHVYSSMSKNAKTLKSYKQGHILKYRSYNANWHIATVYVNGKPQTGYIHAIDVETAVTSQSTIHGVSNIAHVYASASTNSRILKSYKYGHILKYRTFTSNWFEATVFVNGKRYTGYIPKSHVSRQNASLTGYALLNSTHMYSKTSKRSSKLKSYKKDIY